MPESPLASTYLSLCDRSARLTTEMLSSVPFPSLRYSERAKLLRTLNRLQRRLADIQGCLKEPLTKVHKGERGKLRKAVPPLRNEGQPFPPT